MPSSKRRANDADPGIGCRASIRQAPRKRQRVSLACDGCRTNHGRCDGGRPCCSSCASQEQACVYSPGFKKRGIQTGYLRTVELSLAYLFEQIPESEEAIHDLLTNKVSALNDDSGQRLYKKWTDGRIYGVIEHLLANKPETSIRNRSPEYLHSKRESSRNSSSDEQSIESPCAEEIVPPDTQLDLRTNAWSNTQPGLVDFYSLVSANPDEASSALLCLRSDGDYNANCDVRGTTGSPTDCEIALRELDLADFVGGLDTDAYFTASFNAKCDQSNPF